MNPILFKFGSITLYSYGFMIAIGIISALALSLYRAKRLGFNTDVIMNLSTYGVVGGFVGILSTSQFICIFIFFIGFYVFSFLNKKQNNLHYEGEDLNTIL